MTSETSGIPTEHDVAAVEQRLSALWADLSPSQQALLDTIIGAGLAIASPDDARGYGTDMLANPDAVRDYFRDRAAELAEDWRRANVHGASTGAVAPRWNLRPLLDLVRRAPSPKAQPQGGAGD
jgi:hypothetical protein